MKVIKERKEFHLSIKDLVYASSERRISTSIIPIRFRASKGTKAHQAFQKRRKNTEESYQREVLVKFNTVVQGWNFLISGRADIVYEKDGFIIIEEIKSVSNFQEFSLNSIIPEEYRLQLLLYGHFFLSQGKNIKCKLVLIDIYTDKTKIIDVHPQDLTEYINKQCETIFDSWVVSQQLNAEQKNRAKTIIFPFEKFRPNQEDIINKTTQCLQKRGRLMLMAPSGLGKTVGTLYPALKYTMKKNKRLFVVTSKTTQQHIYRDTLRLFAKKKAKFSSIILTAKEKLCINNVFICDKALCHYIYNYEKLVLDEIVSEILTKQVINARHVKKIAKFYEVCPFEISLDCSLYCDVIVGDYNYVFHPYIKLQRFFNKPYDDIILIVDEAHNLPTRAMTYYSPEISLQSVNDVIAHLKSLGLSKTIMKNGLATSEQIKDYITKLLNQYPDRSTKKPVIQKFDKKFFRKIAKDYDQFIFEYAQAFHYQRGQKSGKKDTFIQFVLNLIQFSTILKESDSPEYNELLYLKEGKIKIFCKSAASKLEKQIKGFHSVIMQSATLFPMDYFQKMLGFPSSAQKLQYNSPFPQENRLYLLLPNLSTKYENRQESYDEIALTIRNAVNLKDGNYLAFFPSFGYLKAVKREIESFPLSIELLIQDRKMSEKKRRDLLKKLKDPNKKYLLLAVHGGIFSEGVDFTGDMAIGAFIIGPGLPAYSMEQDLIRKYFESKWEKGFEYAYRNPGMMKVIQAAGRIFRTSTDRGFIMLIGHRFSTPFYNKLFPTDWKIEQPLDLNTRIQNFWKADPESLEIKNKASKTVDLFSYIEKL
ncbi:MAG: helicase C-terminal domain-containing protein [Candidatus Thorarchaeota archaeon]